MGWGATVLRFGANLNDLRARGVSIILEAELRYDYQLEGESDLWLRNRPGSDAAIRRGFRQRGDLPGISGQRIVGLTALRLQKPVRHGYNALSGMEYLG